MLQEGLEHDQITVNQTGNKATATEQLDNQKFIHWVRVLIFPPVYFVDMHDVCVCIFCIFVFLPFTKQVIC